MILPIKIDVPFSVGKPRASGDDPAAARRRPVAVA